MHDHNHDDRYIPLGWNLLAIFLAVLVAVLVSQAQKWELEQKIEQLQMYVNGLALK